ncbi:hypothetical protein [Mycolicibacterium agri]|uniref:hypothetical protein n=1 Tax=Mycolicibacterium agri TaxID=36811 RepID=UPI0010543DAF|nr:hypothetical protein [Mycolicibacterium agri]
MSRVIEGYFRCPFPFTVITSALSEEFAIEVGGHHAAITLPSADGVTPDHIALTEPDWFYREAEVPQSRLAGVDPFWGTAALWRADNTPFAVHIDRFRLCIEVDSDGAGSSRVAREVAEAMPAWWLTVGGWVEVLYEQDLSRLGPVDPGVHFNGTTLWTKLDHVDEGLSRVDSTLGRYNMIRYTPVDAAGLRRCIALGQKSGRPPDEWLVIRDARSFFNGYDFRRAVLDAGLAAELAVTRLITARLTQDGLDDAAIEQTLSDNRMLGRLCRYWISRGGPLPDDYYDRLIARRNAATHQGAVIRRDDARDAIDVATLIVRQALPLPD